MKSRTKRGRERCDELMAKFDLRLNISINKTVGDVRNDQKKHGGCQNYYESKVATDVCLSCGYTRAI